MKKLLTVSLLAIMSVSAANADIASTDYAERVAGTAASQAVSDLVTTGQVKTNTTDIADLKNTINDANTGLATKASSADLNQAKQDLQDAINTAISGDSGVTKQIQALEANKLDASVYNTALADDGAIGKKLDKSTYTTDMSDTGTYGSKIKANADAVSTLGTTKLDASVYNTALADDGAIGKKLDKSTYTTDMSDTGTYGSKIKKNADDISSLSTNKLDAAEVTEQGAVGKLVEGMLGDASNVLSGEIGEALGAANAAMQEAQKKLDTSTYTTDMADTGTYGSKIKANADAVSTLQTNKLDKSVYETALTATGDIGKKLDASTYNTDMSNTGTYGSKIKANADAVSTLQTNSATKAELGINGTLAVPTKCQEADAECALVIINGVAEWQIVQK